jgi:hypothetical protein
MFMTMEYPAYRGALESLSHVLPSYDVEEVVELGRLAYPHFEAISNNDSLTDLFYTYNGSLLTSTFFSMADEYTDTRDLDSSIEAYSSEIQEISNHLLAIADSWKAAGEALDHILEHQGGTVLPIVIGIGIATIGFPVVVLIARRRR